MMREIDGIKIFESVEEANCLDIPNLGICIVKADDELFRYEVTIGGVSIIGGAYNENNAILFAKALKYGIKEKCESCKYYIETNMKCKNDHIDYNDGLPKKGDFLYSDADGYCAWHKIDNNFGCIHHERKETEES